MLRERENCPNLRQLYVLKINKYVQRFPNFQVPLDFPSEVGRSESALCLLKSGLPYTLTLWVGRQDEIFGLLSDLMSVLLYDLHVYISI